LYKAFTEEDHARDFLERGILIMRPLIYFTEIEDLKRKDKDEGEGRVKVVKPCPVVDLDPESGQILSIRQETGEVFFGTASTNPCYLYCFSGPQVDGDCLPRKYGRYVLRVNQPDKLVSEIGSYLERYPDRPSTMWLHCIPVRYDKGQLVGELPEPGSGERLLMSCGQKADRDRHDCEHRLVLRLLVPSNRPEAVRVELGKRPEYVDIMRWPTKKRDASE